MKKKFIEKSSGKPWGGGTPGKYFEKFVFNKRFYIFIPIDVIFHGDYEYEILLVQKYDKERRKP
jgi:hypothetical protein